MKQVVTQNQNFAMAALSASLARMREQQMFHWIVRHIHLIKSYIHDTNFNGSILKLASACFISYNIGTQMAYLCTNGDNVTFEKLCDGISDCEDGDDETTLLCESIATVIVCLQFA